MKSILFTAAFAMILGSASAQKMKATDVPAPVKAKFSSLYPSVTNAKWEKEGANFEAEFEVKEVETSVLIDATGSLIETETEMTVASLPKAVTEYMNKNVPGAKAKEASKIVDAAGKITWEVEANKKDYYFEENGTFIKTVDVD